MKRIAIMGIVVAGVLVAAGPAGAQGLEARLAAQAAVAAEGAMQAQERAAQSQERAREMAERDAARQDRNRDRELRTYEQAQRYLDQAKWEAAAKAFAEVAEMKATRADAALYWKAYSQDRLGQRAEALAAIAVLSKDYPNSRYLKQARALEAEVRQASGQPVRPQDQSDEDLKLMAIYSLQHSDPEQAVPMLEKLLEGNASPRLKERALFVLAQSNSPRAREVLKNYARGSSTPDLQEDAIKYLGIHGGKEASATLAEIYGATTDVAARQQILRAFMLSGDKARLLTAAQSEQNPVLRQEAVRQLGVMGAHDELWAMYQKESSVDVKKQILQAMFVGGNATRMIDLAKTEANPELRRTAVRNLGIMGGKNTGDALVEIYGREKDPSVRRAAVEALFIQDNATALVALARKEEDPAMKKELVQRLSLMKSKVATDYMLEILNAK